MTASTTRELVVVSGYYGFDNLGDEAILEELTNELKQLVAPQNIFVLSADPEKTAKRYGVSSHPRMDFGGLVRLLQRARLFVSGGGGLFQDTRSPASAMFYGVQMMMARLLGARVCVYAQGVGPLKGAIAKAITKRAFASADLIALRDPTSVQMVSDWGLKAFLTADPVWCLQSRPLPPAVEQQLNAIPTGRLVGLSLRTSHNFDSADLEALVKAMKNAVPENAHIILLPLQLDQDADVLQKFSALWNAQGGAATMIDTASLELPSQWITLFGRCKIVVSMRLHALIMSLKAGVPVAGIAYDPKVSHLLSECEQPCLSLSAKDRSAWASTLAAAFNDTQKLSQRAMKKAEGAKKLACQNFAMLSRILNVH